MSATAGSRSWRVGERAVGRPARRRRGPPSAGRTRTRSRRARVGRSTHTSYSGVGVTSSRTGCSCRYCLQRRRRAPGAMRTVSSCEVSRSAAAAAVTRSRCSASASAATRSSSRAPSSRSLASSSAPCPASTFTSTACRQVASGSLHASTRKVQRPSRSGTTVASQRSGSGGELRHAEERRRRRRRAAVQTTFAATASWPSRNTVAVIGRCSPTTARAEKDPQDTTGATSEMPRRRSGRPVIAANAIEVPPHQHLGCDHVTPDSPVGGRGTLVTEILLAAAGGGPLRSLVSTGASSSSVHRPRGAARTPDAPVPARDEPPVVLAPGDARPLRDARPRALAELRRRPGQGAGRGLGRAAGRAGQGPQVRPAAAGRRRRPGGVPHDPALVPVARGRGAGEHRLLLGGVRHHRGAAAVLRRPGHPGRRPPQGRLRPRRPADRRRAALPRPATSRRACPPTAGSSSTTRPSTRTACRSSCCARPTAPPSVITVPLPEGRTLHAHVWRAQVGRVSLLLLDSDIEENAPAERGVTDRLYGGDEDHRLRQEMLLGIGGVRAAARLLRAHRHGRSPRSSTPTRATPGFQGVERIRELHRGARPGVRRGAAGRAGRHGLHHAHAGAGRHRPVPARPSSSGTSPASACRCRSCWRSAPRRTRRSSTWRTWACGWASGPTA